MKSVVSASAPGKLIVNGEHFVVHGSYAVAAAINRRVKVSIRESDRSQIVSGNQVSDLESSNGTLSAVKSIVNEAFEKYGRKQRIKISIVSNIPRGSGLGSSAALSVATAGALLEFLEGSTDLTSISDLALVGERHVHGNPSGIDIAASVQGGVILFSKTAGAKQIRLNNSIQFLVIFSGVTRRTSELIARVAKQRQLFPYSFDQLTQANSFLSLQVVDAMTSGDLPKLGVLMSMAQTTLFWTGVSSPPTDMLVEEALSKGSLGAKLTGAGGGGSVIALPKPELAESVLQHMDAKYPMSFLASVPQEGFRWES